MSSPSEISVWRLLQFDWALDEEPWQLKARAAKALGLAPEQVTSLSIAKRALDARKRGRHGKGFQAAGSDGRRLRFVGHLDLGLASGVRSQTCKRLIKSGKLVQPKAPAALELEGAARASKQLQHVVICGAGPAGLFCALALAKNGIACRVLDRGPVLDDRGRRLVRFHRTREVDREGNLLFGEGGAGTYSDGKIYTRVDHPLEITLLRFLVECGAASDLLYDSLAHIGTDRLHRILPVFRKKLEDWGVRFEWDTRLEGLNCEPDSQGTGKRVRSLQTSAGEIPCDLLFFAPGHSARDTVEWMQRDGMPFVARPFQLGLRIEHPQELINAGRYGDDEIVQRLGAASYNLVSKPNSSVAGAHSFCMCPGGRIVASIQDEGILCTNGMSNSTHSSHWATSALVSTVGPSDFGNDPMDGVRFQTALEQRFFEAGGSDYTAPAQTAADFLAGRLSKSLAKTTYPFGAVPARLDQLLPAKVSAALAAGLERFERVLPGFASEQGQLVGIESRSSSALRIPRDRESYLAEGFENLVPIGEGAGYAGGIMSASLDGARAAQAILERLGSSGT